MLLLVLLLQPYLPPECEQVKKKERKRVSRGCVVFVVFICVYVFEKKKEKKK
jgi:hypothetical protein